jgi:hypothetical protein
VAILAALSSVGGLFAAGWVDFFAGALRALAGAVLRVIFDIRYFPDRGGFIEPFQSPQAAPNLGVGGVAIGTAAAIVRAKFAGTGAFRRPLPDLCRRIKD